MNFVFTATFSESSEFIRSLRDQDMIVNAFPALNDRAKFIRSLRDEESAQILKHFLCKANRFERN